jgi:hypothetical protein
MDHPKEKGGGKSYCDVTTMRGRGAGGGNSLLLLAEVM